MLTHTPARSGDGTHDALTRPQVFFEYWRSAVGGFGGVRRPAPSAARIAPSADLSDDSERQNLDPTRTALRMRQNHFEDEPPTVMRPLINVNPVSEHRLYLVLFVTTSGGW